MPVVEILWVDAWDIAGWHTLETVKELDHNHVFPTYGLLVGEDEYYYYHASTVNQDTGEYRNFGAIPKGMVQDVRIIEWYSYETPDSA